MSIEQNTNELHSTNITDSLEDRGYPNVQAAVTFEFREDHQLFCRRYEILVSALQMELQEKRFPKINPAFQSELPYDIKQSPLVIMDGEFRIFKGQQDKVGKHDCNFITFGRVTHDMQNKSVKPGRFLTVYNRVIRRANSLFENEGISKIPPLITK